jgi:hypothetical protein
MVMEAYITADLIPRCTIFSQLTKINTQILSTHDCFRSDAIKFVAKIYKMHFRYFSMYSNILIHGHGSLSLLIWFLVSTIFSPVNKNKHSNFVYTRFLSAATQSNLLLEPIKCILDTSVCTAIGKCNAVLKYLIKRKQIICSWARTK